MAHGAQHLAAIGLDEIRGIFFQRITEGIICGQEEPAVAALLHQRAAGADRQRIGVIGPMETIGAALLAGQFGGCRPGVDGDLLLVLGERLHGKADRRRGQFHDRIDLFGIVPLAGDIGGHIRLVLVVGGHHLNRRIQHLAAEILNRHLRGFIRVLAAEIGVDTRLVVQDADLDLAV
ncbi:hypothetical protein D3C78_803270 [compost metagenome]